MLGGSKRFGSYLRALREGRRLTLDDVERLTLKDTEPVSRSLLSRLENGRAKLTTHKLLSLSRVYGIRLGTLAERFEVDHETEGLEDEDIDRWPLEKVLKTAAEVGRSGHVHRALLLYEHAETRGLETGAPTEIVQRARLGVARALYGSGRLRLARDLLEELLREPLPHTTRAYVLYLLTAVTLDLDLNFVARAALQSLEEVPRPWTEEIEAHAPSLRAQLLFNENKLDLALEAWLEALDAARNGDYPGAEERATGFLAAVERRRHRLPEAQRWIERCLRLCELHGHPQVQVTALTEAGRIFAARGRRDLARQNWSRARKLARKLDLRLELFLVYVELWRLAKAEKDESGERGALKSIRLLIRFIDHVPREADDIRRRLAGEAGFGGSAPEESGQ